MQEKVEQLVIETLVELNEELGEGKLETITKDSKIFGANGALDSLALVSFITDLEEKISDELEIDIVLADEKAMSQTTSPFRTVSTLTNYILKLLED